MDSTIDPKIEAIRLQEEEEMAKKAAQASSLSYLNLKLIPVDPSGLNLIPLDKAQKAQIAIIQKSGQNLKVALHSPQLKATKDILTDLKNRGYKLTIFIVSLSSLNSVWDRYQSSKTERTKIVGEVEIASERVNQIQGEISNINDIAKKLENSQKMTTSEVLEIILAGALKVEASDIHLENEKEEVRLRYRIDGILQDVTPLPTTIRHSILSRIKILSGLKLNVHDTPQDGRFSISISKKEIEIRTSIIPSAYGESIVLRILNPETISLKLENLGLEEYALKTINQALKKPNGMIVNTGPTGSGKTTTLYAFLKKVNNPKIKIITLEDPIEYHLEGIEQTQIKADKDYTFAAGLRAILRQDPDIILLGEIRDNETAETAVHAALTGHLVFTTLHTNDAAGAIPRLVDMKVNPSLLPPALSLVIAQRLVRKVCPNCAKEYQIDKQTADSISKALSNLPEDIKQKYPQPKEGLTLLRAGQGCEKCNLLGYKGRIAVIELFVVDEKMSAVINQAPSVAGIKKAALDNGMISLAQNGLLKILNKITTLEEVERVLGSLFNH